MNDYTKYKLRKQLISFTEKLFDIIFFLPRKLYKENEKFKNFIQGNSDKSYQKQIFKKCMRRIFYDLDTNENGECVVYCSTDFDNEFDFDREGYDYRILLDDEKWAVKNKLTVERYSLYNYIEKFYKERLYMIADWRKEEFVLVIKRI